jgi:hypothetical protein
VQARLTTTVTTILELTVMVMVMMVAVVVILELTATVMVMMVVVRTLYLLSDLWLIARKRVCKARSMCSNVQTNDFFRRYRSICPDEVLQS